MSQICGNCGNSIDDPDDNWPEVQCNKCGAYNQIVPDYVIKNPDNPSKITFGEYLNYPGIQNSGLTNLNQKQFEKIIKSIPILYSVDNLFQTLDFIYSMNSEKSIEWLGTVTSQSNRFPSNVIAMEILGNMNYPQALSSLVNNISFDYLSENLKASTSGGSIFSSVIQSMAAYSNSKYSDISFAELATAPYIPEKVIRIVPELIRTIQVEMFRLTKVAELISRFDPNSLTSLWGLAKSRDKRKNQEIELFLALLYLHENYSDNTIFSIIKNNILKPIKRNGDYSALILTGNYLVMFSKNNPTNSTYYELLQMLLTHKEPRVKICVASSVFYQNLEQFIKVGIESTTVYHKMMTNVLNFSATICRNDLTIQYLSRQ